MSKYGGTSDQNKECALEDIGAQVDRIDSLLAAMSMEIPAALHLSALKVSLPDIKGKLKQAYFELGGEDFWGT